MVLPPSLTGDTSAVRSTRIRSVDGAARPIADETAVRSSAGVGRAFGVGLLSLFATGLSVRRGLQVDFGMMAAHTTVALGVAAFLVWAVQRVPPSRRPIHDRDVDYILATTCIALAVSIVGLLAPRPRLLSRFWAFDVLAAPIFVVGVSILVFGHRGTARHWRAVAMLFALWPLPYHLISPEVGAPVATFIDALFVGWAGLSVTTGHLARRSVWAGFAVIVAWRTTLLLERQITLPAGAAQLLGAALAVAVLMGTARRLRIRLRPAPSPRPPGERAVPRCRLAFLLVTLAAVALHGVDRWFIRLEPDAVAVRVAAFESATTLTGWHVSSEVRHSVATRYYGPGSSLRRLKIARDVTSPEAPNAVLVDVVDTPNLARLRVFAVPVAYRFEGLLQLSRRVSLSHGVVAELLFYRNIESYRSWVLLTWIVRVESRPTRPWQRITLMLDSHGGNRSSVPAPRPAVRSESVRSLSQLIRGATSDPLLDDIPIPEDGFIRSVGRALVKEASPVSSAARP